MQEPTAEDAEEENYHIFDYDLFYMDIRADASTRVQSWIASNPKDKKEAAPENP